MLRINDFQTMKKEGKPIAMVTAYDYPSAKMAEAADVDMILVGDSLGMVVLGYESTVQVTLDDMLHHAKAVKRGAKDTYIVVDMPFMSCHASLESAVNNAARLFRESGANALKIEGGTENILELTERLTNGGIPVIIHLGLMPQSVNVYGGYKVQGRSEEAAARILREALEAEKSGAVGLLLECIPEPLANEITGKVSIPTIGIGSGRGCDGQVLVYHDLLKYGVDRLAKFAKGYADLNNIASEAIGTYVEQVKSGMFPDDEHVFLK
ncbi:3-methyl-2-oxobutanoate hydroxymethyltransferase [Aciduricibacillus chroicocephali]|uniref:3-methyl-2-oxobutanoate hydroxymethyltransferase n=1 Tax=Aciduricibacillus chroicocephali TaxID=3054939 RepID=A0ABY9KYK1_9BACI|nr:3-methyl-2-oxobutanoate hydroxymethyltransferase [Bacillaceae bacterium 44XB]